MAVMTGTWIGREIETESENESANEIEIGIEKAETGNATETEIGIATETAIEKDM